MLTNEFIGTHLLNLWIKGLTMTLQISNPVSLINHIYLKHVLSILLGTEHVVFTFFKNNYYTVKIQHYKNYTLV